MPPTSLWHAVLLPQQAITRQQQLQLLAAAAPAFRAHGPQSCDCAPGPAWAAVTRPSLLAGSVWNASLGLTVRLERATWPVALAPLPCLPAARASCLPLLGLLPLPPASSLWCSLGVLLTCCTSSLSCCVKRRLGKRPATQQSRSALTRARTLHWLAEPTPVASLHRRPPDTASVSRSASR